MRCHNRSELEFVSAIDRCIIHCNQSVQISTENGDVITYFMLLVFDIKTSVNNIFLKSVGTLFTVASSHKIRENDACVHYHDHCNCWINM